jgi:ankyrin repeat protein
MTPLQCAAVLGYDEIALYLVEHNADVNFPSAKRKYTPLHLAVLANKPEMIIELLTKTNADPMVDDAEGQSLLDMVYKYIPSYVESF